MRVGGEAGSAPGLRAGLLLLPAAQRPACHDPADARAVVAETYGWPIRQRVGGLGWSPVASIYQLWALGDVTLPLRVFISLLI